MITSPLKTHGGKHYLAKRIVAMMPPHTVYCEPYAGGLSVLLAKDPRNVCEVVNDIDGQLTNFWHVLQHTECFNDFRRYVEAVPFSETEWKNSREDRSPEPDDEPRYRNPVRDAARFFINCRMSLAGRGKTFAPISTSRTRRDMCEQVSAWLSCVDGLPAVHDRLRRVAIMNRPALEEIRQLDNKGTLFYLDPPYCPDTRTSKDVYEHEMTYDEHRDLLEAVQQRDSYIMLSGYHNNMYDNALKDWQCTEFDLPNNAAGGLVKRRMTECVWMNFPAANLPHRIVSEASGGVEAKSN